MDINTKIIPISRVPSEASIRDNVEIKRIKYNTIPKNNITNTKIYGISEMTYFSNKVIVDIGTRNRNGSLWVPSVFIDEENNLKTRSANHDRKL